MTLNFDMVQRTHDFERILQLPRRQCTESPDLDSELKTESGTMTLRPVQALALSELALTGGLFAPIQVGGGKTLISLLAGSYSKAQRPVLLLPAKLIKKTLRERAELAEHWRLDPITIFSYEALAFEKGVKKFMDLQPDLIIADECHKLKNLRTARTRCIARYLTEYPDTRMLAMSGTMVRRSLKDFWHILKWCLGQNAPLPLKGSELSVWADALDEGVKPEKRVNPGALLAFCHDKEIADVRAYRLSAITAAREGYQRRFLQTRGVVASADPYVGPPIYVQTVNYPMSAELYEAFVNLRANWETPDGEPCDEAVDLWRHARELACGFYYRWNPRPPEEWLQLRRAWSRFVRQTIGDRSLELDTEMQVAKACATGKLVTDTYKPWQAIKSTFIPNTETVWIDDGALKLASQWLALHEGIVWVEHIAFGERLAELTGLPFFGAGGQDANKRLIEDVSGPIIASIGSNSEGRNLQKWSRNLVISCSPNGRTWEQLMGRTHREGQKAKSVWFDLLSVCIEQEAGFQQAYLDACFIKETLGQNQKLLHATALSPQLFRKPEMPMCLTPIEIPPPAKNKYQYFKPGRYLVPGPIDSLLNRCS